MSATHCARVLVAIACGLLLAPPLFAQAPNVPASLPNASAQTPQVAEPPTPERGPVGDVSLDGRGLLQGHVVSDQGKPIAGAQVWLVGADTASVEARTDRHGRFAYRGLSSGVYRIQTAADVRMCRVWPATAAPPKSLGGVVLVANEATVRGQHGPPPMLNDFVQSSKKFFAHPIGMVAIGAAIATPIAIVASDDDDPPPASP